MRVAFVGVKRKYKELAPEYQDSFDRYHLELPFYFSRDGGNDVTITTVDMDEGVIAFGSGGILQRATEESYVKGHVGKFDVVVHWRKWFPEFYQSEAINVINCQDHTFSPEWLTSVVDGYRNGQLYGILCFPAWHKENLHHELRGNLPLERLLDGVTLGVDPDVYHPIVEKDPYQMLWSSDPGRGFQGALEVAAKLFNRDRRFRLHVCHPDYVSFGSRVSHPAVIWHGNVPNGPKLWDLFNSTGVLPYTSTFKEPSSRAHRQAQAAGSLVLYPPNMGTPSDLIQSRTTGIVEPIGTWVETILDTVKSGEWQQIGQHAREFAISESWAVQAQRFDELFERIRQEEKRI